MRAGLKGPILYTFLEFYLGVDVLKNIYLRYKYQKHLNIFVQLFSQELCWKQIDLSSLINIHDPLFWLACCFLRDVRLGQPQVTRVM